MSLTLQVVASAALVAGVLFFMWRLPRRGEVLFGWAPPLALLSPWVGLLGFLASGLLWLLPAVDRWLVVIFLILDPGAIAAGTLVLWIYRGHENKSETVTLQRVQAQVGIALGMAAVAIGYVFVMTHKQVGTPVGS